MNKKHVYHSKPCDEFGHVHYSNEENETWSFLLERQKDLIKKRASKEFILGTELLGFKNEIPQHQEISAVLKSYTGWGVEPVPALIQPEQFFGLLSNKRFPVANFIRIPQEIDYIKEPDIFHEIFGHCPLLTHAAYAEFMYQFAKIASAADRKIQMRMFRLFWFTIEFGLIKEGDHFLAYGGGILSSKSEIIYSVESDIPKRYLLDTERVLRTPFRIDILQPQYFYITSFHDLFKLLDRDLIKQVVDSLNLPDFLPMYAPVLKKKVE